jgi:hypothetical protein
MLCAAAMWCLLPFLTAGEPSLPPLLVESFEDSPVGAGWPAWGRAQGIAAAAVRPAVVTLGRNHVGRLTYHEAHGWALLTAPIVVNGGRPTALTLKLKGDGAGNRLGAVLVDAEGRWLSTPGLPVTWRDWRDVRLDLTRVSQPTGDDLPPRAPLALLGLSLDFGSAADGEWLLDDLRLVQQPYADLDWLGLALEGPSPSRLYRPEDRPPTLVVLNRGPAVRQVRLSGRLGERAFEHSLTVLNGDRKAVDLALADSGPQTLEVTLTCGGRPLTRRFELAVLPPSPYAAPGAPAPTGGFFGLGHYDLDDLIDGRFARELPDLQAAGAGWTVVRLDRATPDLELGRGDWEACELALAAAWAQGLELVAEFPAAALVTADDQPPFVPRAALRRLGDSFTWWRPTDLAAVPPPALAAAVDQLRRERRPELRLLADPGGAELAERATALWLAPSPFEPVTGGPFPLAARRLAGLINAAAAGPDLWLWLDAGRTADLSGLSEPGATAAAAICARAQPRAVAVGCGPWPPPPAFGPTPPRLLAFATAARLLAEAEPERFAQLAPGLYEARFGGPLKIRAVWSESGPRTLTAAPGEIVYDCLGRHRLGELTVSGEPLYLLTPTAAVLPVLRP